MACCVLMAALFSAAFTIFKPKRRDDAQARRLKTRR